MVNSIYNANAKISSAYIGNSKILKMYLGSSLIYEKVEEIIEYNGSSSDSDSGSEETPSKN